MRECMGRLSVPFLGHGALVACMWSLGLCKSAFCVITWGAGGVRTDLVARHNQRRPLRSICTEVTPKENARCNLMLRCRFISICLSRGESSPVQ